MNTKAILAKKMTLFLILLWKADNSAAEYSDKCTL